MKAFGKGTSAACVEDCDDSDEDPFVPNDFAEDDPFQASEVKWMILIWRKLCESSTCLMLEKCMCGPVSLLKRTNR